MTQSNDPHFPGHPVEHAPPPPVDPKWKTVLVMGGGGMKGIAHIGAIRALEEAGIRPDAVIGTSIGAVIAVLVAGGLGWREMSQVATRLKKEDIVSVNRRAMWLGGVRAPSVFNDGPFREWLDRILPVLHFDELMVPVRINATSLVTGHEVWFGSGHREDVNLVDAVYASCALPVFFPPARIADDVLVDGGVINALPLSEAEAWGAERIISIDVGADFVPPREGMFEQGMIAIHERVLNLSIRNQRVQVLERYRHMPYLYIRPQVGHHYTWDFEQNQFFMDEGYRAAREALEKSGDLR